MDVKEHFFRYLAQFIGKPYVWGGNGSGKTDGGFDCSGLVLEGLWAFGLFNGADTSAEGLRAYAAKNWKTAKSTDRGAILFFGTNGKANHTAAAIGDGFMIEAGGAGSEATTAAASNGFVRIRPVANRKNLIAAYMPNFG